VPIRTPHPLLLTNFPSKTHAIASNIRPDARATMPSHPS
jgi:hypothetical protein